MPMTKDDILIKLYRRLGKKRYLKGKYVYEHERIYVPIPSRLHKMIKPLLNQRLEMEMTDKNDGLVITLRPAKTLRHVEYPPAKLPQKAS